MSGLVLLVAALVCIACGFGAVHYWLIGWQWVVAHDLTWFVWLDLNVFGWVLALSLIGAIIKEM